jgi:predicted site-specific integrase-resolvase
MATQTASMTTSDFAKAAGVSAASISKLIRDGRLKAKKVAGKWMIAPSQLSSKAVRGLKGSTTAATRKAPAAKKTGHLRTKAVPPLRYATEEAPIVKPPEPAPADLSVPAARPAEKTYTIPEFAAMTYLTENGVAEWLKAGRIRGFQNENGEWRVLESTLQIPDISRLLRK